MSAKGIEIATVGMFSIEEAIEKGTREDFLSALKEHRCGINNGICGDASLEAVYRNVLLRGIEKFLDV